MIHNHKNSPHGWIYLPFYLKGVAGQDNASYLHVVNFKTKSKNMLPSKDDFCIVYDLKNISDFHNFLIVGPNQLYT